MKKGVWIALFVAWFCFIGCETNTDSEKPPAEKDHIEKVSDAAGRIGYDGEAIEKGLRDVDKQSKDREKAADDLFNE